MQSPLRLATAVALSLLAAASASASSISTHILDLARGTGGRDVPVSLQLRQADGSWQAIGAARTDGNGRVKSFGDGLSTPPGTYRLVFDMRAYPDKSADPFFPEIAITFRVVDAGQHYHVPVVVSPYGYSTYRGN
jgi:5-hydroxyisourate hydrolase